MMERMTPEEDAEFAEAINAMRSQDLECRQNRAGEMTVGPSVVKMIRRDRERIREAQVKRDRKAAKRMGISLEEYLAQER